MYLQYLGTNPEPTPEHNHNFQKKKVQKVSLGLNLFKRYCTLLYPKATYTVGTLVVHIST